MQTITVQINNDHALKTLLDLETRHFINILDRSENDSPALPGSGLSLKEFNKWINEAELTSSVSLNDAKEKWAGKRRQLQNLIK